MLLLSYGNLLKQGEASYKIILGKVYEYMIIGLDILGAVRAR